MPAESQISVLNQVVASFWTCLLLSAFLCEPVLSKGGRGGARGSSRGSSSRSSIGGNHRGGAYGGTRSRFKASGRSSPVRVASAAAAGAAVALTADKWYASAYRRSNTRDSVQEEFNYLNRTDYFDAQMSGSKQNGSFLAQVISVIIVMLYPVY
ncbi:shadow of prion protein [Genypterus blacodes]|uniref:shadow of prion protein n=1 Tax=Genypterus blacodes TaxID=154954 RepID=UPI003F75F8B0